MLIYQISHVIFESISQFSFKFCIDFQCHQTWLVCTFLAQTFYALVKGAKGANQRAIFFRFSSAWVKISQIPHVNFEMTIQFLFKIASFFIVMTYNSSINFKLIRFLRRTKGPYKSPNFDTFECSSENMPNSSCHFPNHNSVFLQILHDSSVSWKITPL